MPCFSCAREGWVEAESQAGAVQDPPASVRRPLLHWCTVRAIDVINVYNVYKKIRCKRVYYFVNVYLTKNHMSETKQNYDGKPSYSALRSNRSLIEFIGSRC